MSAQRWMKSTGSIAAGIGSRSAGTFGARIRNDRVRHVELHLSHAGNHEPDADLVLPGRERAAGDANRYHAIHCERHRPLGGDLVESHGVVIDHESRVFDRHLFAVNGEWQYSLGIAGAERVLQIELEAAVGVAKAAFHVEAAK